MSTSPSWCRKKKRRKHIQQPREKELQIVFPLLYVAALSTLSCNSLNFSEGYSGQHYCCSLSGNQSCITITLVTKKLGGKPCLFFHALSGINSHRKNSHTTTDSEKSTYTWICCVVSAHSLHREAEINPPQVTEQYMALLTPINAYQVFDCVNMHIHLV